MKGISIEIFFVLGLVLLTNGQRDQTLEPKTYGFDVVSGVSMKIRLSDIFTDDNRFLVRMAYVETKYGEDPLTYNRTNSGGIWQVSENIFTATKTLNTTTIRNHRLRIQQLFNITWENTTWADLEKPMYSGLAIKLFLGTLPQVPDTVSTQADFWRQYIHVNGSTAKFISDVRELEKENICEGKMDLVIVLDGSGSIPATDFRTAKNFVVNLASTFDKNDVRIGFVVYSAFSRIIFQVNNTLNDTAMTNAIQSATQPGGGTRTDLAIESAIQMMPRNESNSVLPRVLTVFTDGQSDSANLTILAAAKAKREGLISFSVGIGNGIKRDELIVIAGGDPSRVISSSSFDALTELPYRVNEETCTVPQTPPTNGNVEDSVKKNETRYFEYQVPLTGITIQIKVTSGQASGYFSFTFPTPSSAIHDGIINGATFIPARNVRNIFGDNIRQNRQSANSSRLYVAVKGAGENKNDFNIVSDEGDRSHSTRIVVPGIFLLLTSLFFSTRA